MKTKIVGGVVVALLFLVAGTRPVWSQSVSKELPEGPLLRPAPEFSQWSIDYSYPQDRQDKAGALAPIDPKLPRKVLLTKTKDILREEVQTVSGVKTDAWQQNGNYFVKFPGNTFWSAYEKPTQLQIESGTAVTVTVPSSGFRGLDWINQETYAGTVTSGESTYLIFLPAESRNADLSDQKVLQELPTIAYVDAKTRLPVRVKKHEAVSVYKFMPPPGAMLTIPPDLAAEIKAGEEIRAKSNAAPMREY